MLSLLAQRPGQFRLSRLLSYNVHLVGLADLAATLANKLGGDGLVKLSHFLDAVLWTVETLLDKISLFSIRRGVSAEHVVMLGQLERVIAPCLIVSSRQTG